jgi:membrane protease subunit (stomatin/prohibitin family)
MPLLRRRPLMRAAMIGGGAYAAGKHVARGQEHEAEQDAQLAAMQQQPVYDAPPPSAPPAAAPADPMAALMQAKELLDAGVLTQAEFDAQKARILS